MLRELILQPTESITVSSQHYSERILDLTTKHFFCLNPNMASEQTPTQGKNSNFLSSLYRDDKERPSQICLKASFWLNNRHTRSQNDIFRNVLTGAGICDIHYCLSLSNIHQSHRRKFPVM